MKEFNDLFARYRNQLVRFLARRVASHEAAADLAQDAYVRLPQAESAGGGRGAEIQDARAYPFRTAANLATDHSRQHLMPTPEPARAIWEAFADPAPTPESVVFSRAELYAIQLAIDELPPRCRSVFLLARVHGLTFAEIGRRLGISPKTAFGHTARALAHITQRMRDKPIPPDRKKDGIVRLRI